MPLISMKFRQAQMILDAFRTLRSVPLLYAAQPTGMRLAKADAESLLQRIRDAKALLAREYPRMAARDFAELREKQIGVPLNDDEANDIILALATMVREAETNPPHIRVLVGTQEEILALIAALREGERPAM